jgi:hypothetical protein
MLFGSNSPAKILAPRQKTAQQDTFPASVGGINALESLMLMPPEDCLYCHNLMPSEYGMRLRKGYTQWAIGMDGESVNTILPYEGQLADAIADKCFAVTPSGIWDVTVRAATPVRVVPDSVTGPPPPWTDATGDSGFGVSVEFSNDANDHYLQYADGENGLWEYAEETGLWGIPDITFEAGTTTVDIAYVMNWKNRLWYIPRDSGEAWYLEPDSKSGQATKFTFGSKFPHGGELKSLFSWTLDGGVGADDYLVAVSRGGDVLIYSGIDPSSVDSFGLTGAFYVGEFPESRRIGIAYGGEFYLLSTYGVTSLRDLLQGVDPTTPGKSPSAKVNRFLRDAVAVGKDSNVWSLTIYPADGFLSIISPWNNTNPSGAIQYNQNLLTTAWGMWRGVPAQSAEEWSGRYMIGDKTGSVWEYTGGLDGVTIEPDPDLGGYAGRGIDFNVLTSFQAPGGDPTSYKRVGFIRPIQLNNGVYTSTVKAIYDYDVAAVLGEATPGAPERTASWATSAAPSPDDSLWDVATWDYGLIASSRILGSLGMGRTVAIGMTGSSSNRLTFVGWDVSWSVGGFL